MATPGDNDQKSAEDKENNDSNPVIENKTEQTGKGKKKKLFILIGVLILLLAGGSYFAISFFKEDPELSEETEGEATPEEEVAEEGSKKVNATFALDPFLVNLADNEDVRFIKIALKLGLAEEPEQEATDIDIAAIRDSIITLLTSKTSVQMLTPQGKQTLREQVSTRMNELSLGFNVVEVYIIDFVVQ